MAMKCRPKTEFDVDKVVNVNARSISAALDCIT